ncbi:hypothetical protein GCM10022409_44500 [Hymenobacter glaciei]|uniref:Uncharacterized protein n=1 Tax=Hymenobacter glaciei TaxID=877209 RepID=A0ABP7UUB7_9BACT
MPLAAPVVRASGAVVAAPVESDLEAIETAGMLIDWLVFEGFSFSLTVVAQLLRKASSPRAARGERKRDFMEFRCVKPGR